MGGGKAIYGGIKKENRRGRFYSPENFSRKQRGFPTDKSPAMLRIENVNSDSALIRMKAVVSAFPCARLITVDASSGAALIECREDVRHQNQLLNSLQQAGFRGGWEKKE